MRKGNMTRIIISALMLFMYGAGDVWADISVTIDPAITNGSIITQSVNQSTREVTLTVTPASGYYIKASDIEVEPLVGMSNANSRGMRRAPRLASLIVGKMYDGSKVVSVAVNPTEATYKFTLPEKYDGAYVSATFRSSEGLIWITGSTTSVTYNANGHYILAEDVDASVVNALFSGSQSAAFTGTFEGLPKADGTFPKISGLTHALFDSIAGGTVKNVMLDSVKITTGNNVGAIANNMTGTSSKKGSIYNCGVLSGSVSGSGYVGGLVGQLGSSTNNDSCYARVINCFSYADIKGGTDKGGIVGYNNCASTQASLTTMVMNCMFYGDISNGNAISPIYGGEEINNVAGGMNNYNYYRYNSRYSVEKKITKYNRALAMEEKFITRFERYRLLLNSNKKLATKYADITPNELAKWVLETADRTISNPMPYPVLKAQGKYPSIINPDIDNAPDSVSVGRLNGGKVSANNGKLSVTILTKSKKTTGGQSWPTAAASDVQTTSLDLIRTDKDTTRYNFNYDKVQLPYYNDVGTGNYTENRVVTGWKITSITGGTPGSYEEEDTWGGYNFADRKCTNKDLYTVSKRVFSQGAYWDVPEDVTAITIEPYWAIANYVSDGTYDVVYDKDYASKGFTPFGTQYSDNKNIDIYGDGNNNQKVYTSISNALSGFDNSSKTVYDQAVVLVGNVHQNGNPTSSDIPYTVMSIDLNHDNEPDYSYIFGHDNRKAISPIRYDFLNIVGIAEAHIPNGASKFRNVSIFNVTGWFEITNTCVIHFEQFEYDNSNYNQKSAAPLILLGGSYKQFVSTKIGTPTVTTYIHVGGNAWFAKFGNGTHSDGSNPTKHIPISVTGGDYDEFYLSGTYQPTVTAFANDPAECYVSGGRFGEMAGASLEQIDGDVRWQIDWADITNFFGGGVNDNNPITGNIQTDITNSHVALFCGGPKFGDMESGKTVITDASSCTFDTYCGAGYGGTSLNRVKYWDASGLNPKDKQGEYTNDRGKYFDGATTNAPGNANYGKKGKGVATDFDYDFFYWSTGVTGGRFYVKFASFSLATTNDVTSTLNGCNITGNFYGGGYLGKVAGTAASTLDSCTVKGNVFGGGYSASLPPVYVRKTPAFTKNPAINNNIGMFEMGEINKVDTFEWKQIPTMPSNNTIGIEESGKFVYTDKVLTTLGEVDNVVLTLTGTTTVGGHVLQEGENAQDFGNVFGGGEESSVKFNTIVNIQGDTEVKGNVFGGGDEGVVEGKATVNIEE